MSSRHDEPPLSAGAEPVPESEVLDALRLALVDGVGPRIRKALVERFGSATAALDAAPSDLRAVPGVGAKLVQRIAAARGEPSAEECLEDCRRENVRLLADTAADYPQRLREIGDPPGVLFVRGQITAQDAMAVAIVGSRHATQYGTTQAQRLAGSLARAGFTIVSGLARGIDGAAHRGALEAGGRTLAVLGSGVLNIYPPEHAELAYEIQRSGAVISESPPRSPPLSGAFPQRNRLISGLALGVVVVEASVRSGALITARHAMEQGREVFAVPGRVDSRASHGCHRLIRDGAKLVESADDIIEELGPLASHVKMPDGGEIHHPAELLLNEPEQKVLSAVGTDATPIDRVIAESGLPTSQVLSTLTVLETRRLVRRLGGSAYLRNY